MASSISNLFNCLAEGTNKIKCNCGHDDKNCETRGIRCKDCECCLEYTNVKDNLIEYTFLCCNKNYPKMFHKILKNIFANTYKFSNHNINKLILLLPKGVYPYKYIDDLKKFDHCYQGKKIFTVT